MISRIADSNLARPNFLVSRARSHKYLVLDGRRILPSQSLTKANNSIIQADFDGIRYAGQIIKIFAHEQPEVPGRSTLVSVRWFKRVDVDTTKWDP